MRHAPLIIGQPRLWLAAALLAGGVGAAQAHTSVSVGVGFGVPVYSGVAVGIGPGYYGGYRGYHGHPGYYRGGWARGWGPGVYLAAPIIIDSEPVYREYREYAEPPVVVRPPVVAAAPMRPDPVIYPRNGQDGQQTEYDRQACNRWATTQPSAVADASVFQRAVEACMDGRGYSMK